MFKLPEDILRYIYYFDNTYKIIYNKCLLNMLHKCHYKDLLKQIKTFQNIYENHIKYCKKNSERFNNNTYFNPKKRVEYYLFIQKCIKHKLNLKLKNL